MRSPGDGGRGVCSPSAAAATLSTSTAILPPVTASARESAHPPAAVDTPMTDTYSGSSPMNFLISPVRPFNLLRSLESQENLPENGVRVAAEEDTAIEMKNSRKKSKPGSSTRVGSEETRNVYEQAFMMASQRESGQIFEPIVGTTFDSEVDAIQYYNTYSWEVGFGIRKGKKYVNSEKYKTMQTLLCSCEGTAPGCVKDSVRKQCKAMVRMKRTSDHGWFFETVVTEHNHELADTVGEKRHWQCHNQIDPFLKDVIRHMRGNNIPLNQVYGVLCDCHGGSESLPFRKRSLRATCSMIAQEASQDDINKLMDLFAGAQLDNGDFFHSVDTDEDKRVRSIFWCHAKSRADYACFGDVVTFDTTYKCNLYEMPVGLFIGVNNHFQCCLFGCVVLRQETEEAFEWAFRTFLKAMKGKHPITILTDQCRQMEVAISAVMPNTVHRWCKWHVLKHMREKLGSLYGKDQSFKRDLDFVLNEMMTIDEFEAAWVHLVGEYGLTGNTYMMQVFDCRDKWAKPYFKNQFCAKMTSTQRNECMNHVLKTYVSRSAPLNRFFMQYTKLIADRWGEEDAAQAHTKQVVKSLRSGVPIENHAYKVYTHAMFLIFSDILYKSGSFMVRGPPEGGAVVLEHFDAERRSKYFKVRYEVDVDLVRSEFKCECGLFEHTGMLCRHVLKAMVHYGVSQIPSRYIIKRWTRNARDVLPEDIRCYQRDSETGVSKTYRHNVLYMKALEIVKLGDVSLETFAVAMRNLDNTKKQLIEASEKIISGEKCAPRTGHCTEADSNVQVNGSTQPRGFADMDGAELHNEIEENTNIQPAVRDVYKAPENRPSRGRPVTRRMQSRSERAKGNGKEKDVCAICGSGQHEMTNCPAMEVDPCTELSGNDSLSGRPDGAAEADEIESNQEAGLDDTPTVRHTPKTTSRRDSSSAKPRGGKAKPPSAPRRCKICGNVGHYAPKCPQNDQERAPVSSPVCKTCGLSGHMSNTCGRESTYKRK